LQKSSKCLHFSSKKTTQTCPEPWKNHAKYVINNLESSDASTNARDAFELYAQIALNTKFKFLSKVSQKNCIGLAVHAWER